MQNRMLRSDQSLVRSVAELGVPIRAAVQEPEPEPQERVPESVPAPFRSLGALGYWDTTLDQPESRQPVEITVERSVELPDGNPLRWQLTERSPFNP